MEIEKNRQLTNMQSFEDKTETRNRLDNNCSSKYTEFLLRSIKEKEADLECPVCLETAEGEIYSCLEQHLLCSSCGPRVAECPECRAQCRDPPRRHRYAERMAAELINLRQELAIVTEAERSAMQ